MPIYECAICQQPVRNNLVCRECRKAYAEDDPWVSYLLRYEKDCRNRELKDLRHGVVCLSDLLTTSDGQTYDGWDMLDGNVEWVSGTLHQVRLPSDGEGKHRRKPVSRDRRVERALPPPAGANVLEEPWEEQLAKLGFSDWSDTAALRLWAHKAGLTRGEFNAVYIQATHSPDLDEQVASTQAAEALSQLEGHRVSPSAFRRRLSDARRKLRAVLSPLLRAG